jgi:hypothetical protein
VIDVTGIIDVDVTTERDGTIVTERQTIKNLVVDAGLNLIRDRLAGTSSASVTHLAVGTNAAAVTALQTTLSTEVFRNVLTQTITSSTKTVQFKLYLAANEANGNTLREIGLFTASTGGTMYARALLASPIVKNASTTVTFTWTTNLSAT